MSLQLSSISTNGRLITATVLSGGAPLSPTDEILWFSQPADNIFHYLNGTQYTQYTSDTVSDIGTIILSASDQTELSSVYTYYVSAIGGLTASDTFRPYLSGIVSLTYVINDVYNELNTTVYDIKMLGSTSGTMHNLDSAYPLYYRWTPSNIQISMIDNVVPYDTILVRINNPIVDTIGALVSSTYTIYASTLSGIDPAINAATSVNILLTGNAYPSTLLFNPVLRIDNITPTPIIYKELPFSSHTYTLSADANSILLPTTGISGTYSFYKDGISLSSGSFINASDLSSKNTFDIVSPITTPTSTTYTFSVSANYNPNVVKSYSTLVKYVSVDSINSSNIQAYPEYLWQPLSGWKLRVNPDYSLNTISGGILYGQGRSENVLLSATNIPGVILYKWTVYNSGTIIYQGDTTSNVNWITIKSDCNTTNIDIRLGVYNADSINIPDGTNVAVKYTALTFNTVSASISAPTINVPTSIAAPGPISANIINDGATDLQVPIYADLNTLTLNTSCSYWTSIDDTIAHLTLSDIGDRVLSVPKFEKTPLNISITPIYTLSYYPSHPRYTDWCNISSISVGSTINTSATAFPINPYYYTPNKFTLTGNVSFDNVVPYNDLISGFAWSSVSSTDVVNFDPYVENYTLSGIYGLTMTSHYSGNDITLINNDAIHIYNNYPIFNPIINRTIGEEILPLPYKCGIGANEWLTSDNINLSFKKIYDNLDHLIYQSKIYDNPPTQYIGWLGNIRMSDNTTRFRWFVETPGLNYEYDNPTVAISSKFNNIQDCVVRNNIMYISDSTIVHILSSDFNATQISSKNVKSIGIPFNNIKVIQLDSIDQNRIYLLDTISMEVIVYLYNDTDNSWTLLYTWGGLGSATSKNKYNNPQDMFVDGDKLWIADTNNLVVKKYTRTGAWISTITSSKFTNSNKPLSICNDSDNNLQVLCTNNIIVFDSNGNYLYEYTIGSGCNKIRPCIDGGFVYISSSNNIVKCKLDGSIQLSFNNSALNSTYELDNRSIYHDEYRNLYVCQNNHILKYNDQIKYVSLIKDSSFSNMWSLDEIYIKKQENVQDWVINKSLNRLWDNIEIVRKSVMGKLSYEHVVNVDYKDNDVPVIDPVSGNECLIDWWPNFNVNVGEAVTNCYTIPRIRTFVGDEYKLATHNKDDVLIGVNELVSADVINRVLCQLQDNLMSIYDMLKNSYDKSDELCSELEPVETETYDSYATSLSQCYPEFYNLYSCQYATYITGASNPCVGQEVLYNVNIIATSGCKAEIKQITWLIDNVEMLSVPYESHSGFLYSFGENDVGVPHTLTMVLSANGEYTTSIIVTPKLCMSSILTGPLTACTGSEAEFLISVDSEYVPVSGYSWTNNGTTVRTITTTSIIDQYVFQPQLTGARTITVTPLLYNFSIPPAILTQTQILTAYNCLYSPPNILPNTYMYFIVDDSAGFNTAKVFGAINDLYGIIGQYYGSRANYDDKVKIHYINTERTLNWIGVEHALLCDGRACNPYNAGTPKLTRPDQNNGNYVVFAFQNEALNNGGPAQYHNSSGAIITSNNYPTNSTARAYFTEDMARLKTQLGTYRQDYFHAAIFTYKDDTSSAFTNFFKSITVNDTAHQYLGAYSDTPGGNKKIYTNSNAFNESRSKADIINDIKAALTYFGFIY